MFSPDELIDHATRLSTGYRPLVIAIDGRSGVGKSTLAMRVATALGAFVIEGDAFFGGGVGIVEATAESRADLCIDRPKLGAVLEALRGGRPARYRSFDWEMFDGRLKAGVVEAPVVGSYIVEGVYACHPDFHSLVDLKVLASADPTLREQRLLAREGVIGPWERQWHEAEEWYFGKVMTADRFDLQVDLGRPL